MSAASSIKSVPAEKKPSEPIDNVRQKIEDARSADLVFAIAAHLGSGESTVTKMLVEELTKSFDYETHVIDASELILDTSERVNIVYRKGDGRLNRTEELQEKGDRLREKFGKGIISGLAIQKIGRKRNEKADSTKPLAFIVDSLKHPDEVDVLRDVYGEAFFLISIVCNMEARLARLSQQNKYGQDITKGLINKDHLEQRIMEIMKRDEADVSKKDYGQQVRKTLHRADYFVNNSDVSKTIGPQIQRLLRIIFGQEIERPNKDERGIYAAWGAAMRSACLSRQVGAAVMSSRGEIVSTGSNDVPQFDGGLYSLSSDDGMSGEERNNRDHRCHNTDIQTHSEQLIQISRLNSPGTSGINHHGKTAYCRNDLVKQTIYEDIFERLTAESLLSGSATLEIVRAAIESTRIKDLVEYSRAIHAEMDALLSLTRSSGSSPVGGTIYCTTYPCHNCARHIVAAGIHEVVYIEPYPKSMALVLHSDSIEETVLPYTENEHRQKVRFRLFSGVAPRRYADLFEKRTEIKDKGFLVKSRKRHRDPSFNKSFLDLEKSIAEQVETDISTPSTSGS